MHLNLCVFSSMQFNQIHVTTTTTSQDTEHFYHKDSSCYTLIASHLPPSLPHHWQPLTYSPLLIILSYQECSVSGITQYATF